MDIEIGVTERELDDKRSRGYYHRDYWNGYRWVYRSRGTAVTLGPEASQIDKLWVQYRAMLDQLRTMNAGE